MFFCLIVRSFIEVETTVMNTSISEIQALAGQFLHREGVHPQPLIGMAKWLKLDQSQIVKAVHEILVTGGKCSGPAKIISTHWIPEVCLSDANKGYGQKNLGNIVKLSTHQLMVLAFQGTHELMKTVKDSNKTLKSSISHLCAISGCCNPQHLVVESHSNNMLRQKCAILKVCQEGRHDLPKCLLDHPISSSEVLILMSQRSPKMKSDDRLKSLIPVPGDSAVFAISSQDDKVAIHLSEWCQRSGSTQFVVDQANQFVKTNAEMISVESCGVDLTKFLFPIGNSDAWRDKLVNVMCLHGFRCR